MRSFGVDRKVLEFRRDKEYGRVNLIGAGDKYAFSMRRSSMEKVHRFVTMINVFFHGMLKAWA